MHHGRPAHRIHLGASSSRSTLALAALLLLACSSQGDNVEPVPSPGLGQKCDPKLGDDACTSYMSCVNQGNGPVCAEDGTEGTVCTSQFGCTDAHTCLAGTCRADISIVFDFDECQLSDSSATLPVGKVDFKGCQVVVNRHRVDDRSYSEDEAVLLSATGDDDIDDPAPGSVVLTLGATEGPLTLGDDALPTLEYLSDSGVALGSGELTMLDGSKLYGPNEPELDLLMDFGTYSETLDEYGHVVVGEGDESFQLGGEIHLTGSDGVPSGTGGSGGSGGSGGTGGSGGGGGTGGSSAAGGMAGTGATSGGLFCNVPCERWAKPNQPATDADPWTLCTLPYPTISGFYQIGQDMGCSNPKACSFYLDGKKYDDLGFTGIEGAPGTELGKSNVRWRVLSDENCALPDTGLADKDSSGASIGSSVKIVFRFDGQKSEGGTLDAVQEAADVNHYMLWYETSASAWLTGWEGPEEKQGNSYPY